MSQGVETNSISVHTAAKTLKIKIFFFPIGFTFALKKDKSYAGKKDFFLVELLGLLPA